jgi:peptidoglycan/xylan/chitin deacetylase (PgdA/CDA1 family)
MPRDVFVDDVQGLIATEADGVQLLFSVDDGNAGAKHREQGRSSTLQTRSEVERLHEALGRWLGVRP